MSHFISWLTIMQQKNIYEGFCGTRTLQILCNETGWSSMSFVILVLILCFLGLTDSVNARYFFRYRLYLERIPLFTWGSARFATTNPAQPLWHTNDMAKSVQPKHHPRIHHMHRCHWQLPGRQWRILWQWNSCKSTWTLSPPISESIWTRRCAWGDSHSTA